MGPVKGILLLSLVVAVSLQLTPSALASSGISVKLYASPAQVQGGQSFEVLVSVSNGGATAVSGLSVNLVVPTSPVRWNYTLLGVGSSQLGANQTELVRYRVSVPASALVGSYTLLAVANTTSSSSEGNTTVQVQSNPTTIPIGGGQIPVSLILILAPGFFMFGIIQWIRGKQLDSAWQASLLSFFFGSVAWFLGPWPAGPPLQLDLLNINPATMTTTQVVEVGAWAVIVGIIAGAAFLGGAQAKARAEGWLAAQFENLAEKRRGYIYSTSPEWALFLDRQYKETMKKSGRNYRPALTVTTAQSLSNPPTERPVEGLLAGYDDKTPYDIALGPQYVLTIAHGGDGWNELVKAFPEAARTNLDMSNLKESFEKSHLSDDTDCLVDRILKAEPSADYAFSTRFTLTGQELVRGDDIRRILVTGYLAKFVIRVTQSRTQSVELF